jgi:hypothetical protein
MSYLCYLCLFVHSGVHHILCCVFVLFIKSTADLRNYWTEFHETWWSYRYMFQLCVKGGQSHIFRGSKGVGVTIESYGKVEISYINVENF